VRRRPSGADNFLKLRRAIDEHLELRRITWSEFAMFVWLCVKATPRTGTLRTGWPTLALQTGLSADRVEQLCRALRRKRYVWYPSHRGSRGRLIELAIDKFPTVDGGYTDLSARFGEITPEAGRSAEVATDSATRSTAIGRRTTEWTTELARSVARNRPMATELDGQRFEESRGSPLGRPRKRKEKEEDRDGDARALRARLGLGAPGGQAPSRGDEITTPVAVGDVLAAQPWWRSSPDGRPSPTAETGATRSPQDTAR
jgi:hypothetical protein